MQLKQTAPLLSSYAALWLGVSFLVMLNALIVLCAHLHWADDSGGVCVLGDVTNSTEYATIPNYAGCRQGSSSRFLPDQGAWWYYWRLPEPTVASRLFVWASYVCHQTAAWTHQYHTQKRMMAEPEQTRYSPTLRPFNVQQMAIHAFFHLLHLLQTHTTYDGLHGDVSFQSSQASVIALIGVVLAMEAPKRGMVLGIPSHRGLTKAGMYVVRKYHGYVFQYAAIFTFWCHPMEPLWGFLMGFSHTGMLMLQAGLMYTTAHKNPYWRCVLEGWVTVHATAIAMQTLPGWQQFFFGFLALLCLSQLPGLPALRAVRGARGVALRALPAAGFAAGFGGWYVARGRAGGTRVMAIFGIPMAEYLVAFAVPFVLWPLVHPRLAGGGGGGGGAASSRAGRALGWAVFVGSALAAIGGGLLDWQLPYASWKATGAPPRAYAFSYVGMAVATLGLLWAPARLLGGPPAECFGGGCCGATVCCAPPPPAAAHGAPATSTAPTEEAAGKAARLDVLPVDSTEPQETAMA